MSPRSPLAATDIEPIVPIEFRAIQPQDSNAVREFLAGLGWEHHVADSARFRKMMERADRTVVALEDGRVIGFGRALCDGVSNGYLSMIAVAEDKRGQGIGREIVRQLMAGNDDNDASSRTPREPGNMRDDGSDVTWVLRAGRDSSAFWKKLGFVESRVAMERVRKSGKL
jgi:GNAT superfamily N-acetyltransferase